MCKPQNTLLTTDGSHTITSDIYNETYHSIHGAITESKHVFIQSGIDYYLENNNKSSLKIFEMGMGTGLNVYLSYLKAQPSLNIDFTSIELHPIDPELVEKLNYPALLLDRVDTSFNKIHTSNWISKHQLSDFFSITKYKADITQFDFGKLTFDIIFYDAFGPKTQPLLWKYDILKKMYDILEPGGIFVTYCAMGQMKRDLKAIGFKVQSLPGPPGKREMVRAVKV